MEVVEVMVAQDQEEIGALATAKEVLAVQEHLEAEIMVAMVTEMKVGPNLEVN